MLAMEDTPAERGASKLYMRTDNEILIEFCGNLFMRCDVLYLM